MSVAVLHPNQSPEQQSHAAHAALREAVIKLQELSREHPQFIDDRTLNRDAYALGEIITGARYKRMVFSTPEYAGRAP